jgi:hypothetical protein
MAHINKQLKNIFLILIIFSASVSASDASSNLSNCEEKPSVYIISPQNGFVSDSNNVEINPAGKGESATKKCFASGHHHLLVNIDQLPESFIPFDEGYYHFGGGQTEVILDLEPGTYSLQLILGSYVHNSRMQVNNFAGQGPFISEKITIRVN